MEDFRFSVARRLMRWLMPSYRLGWPQLAWWHDESFNNYLAKFDELGGLNTARRWMLGQLLRLVVDVPGDTAECGVFEGAGSYLIAMSHGFRQQARRHHIFDSFEGLSEPQDVDGSYWRRGDMARSFDRISTRLADVPGLVWHRGWIPHTFAEVKNCRFSFVHIDVDLYQPTRDSLSFFYDRLNPGGIIVCDDYQFTTCPGATKAVEEILADKPEKMLTLPSGGGFFIKGTKTAPFTLLASE